MSKPISLLNFFSVPNCMCKASFTLNSICLPALSKIAVLFHITPSPHSHACSAHKTCLYIAHYDLLLKYACMPSLFLSKKASSTLFISWHSMALNANPACLYSFTLFGEFCSLFSAGCCLHFTGFLTRTGSHMTHCQLAGCGEPCSLIGIAGCCGALLTTSPLLLLCSQTGNQSIVAIPFYKSKYYI